MVQIKYPSLGIQEGIKNLFSVKRLKFDGNRSPKSAKVHKSLKRINFSDLVRLRKKKKRKMRKSKVQWGK